MTVVSNTPITRYTVYSSFHLPRMWKVSSCMVVNYCFLMIGRNRLLIAPNKV